MNNRLKTGLFLTLLLFLLADPIPVHAERTVTVGFYDFKPLIFKDRQDAPAGLFFDILDHVAHKQGWRMKYVYGTWQETYQGLLDGKLDLVPCIGNTEARKKQVDFSNEYLFLDWGVIYSRPDSGIESILDLKGARVAALRGSVYTEGLRQTLQQFDITPNFSEEKSYTDVFRALDQHQADAGISTSLTGIGFEKEFHVRRTPIIFSPTKLAYAVKKGMNGDLVSALDLDIKELKADPASLYHDRYDHWITNVKRSHVPHFIWWCGAGVLAGGVFLIFWNVVLKRQVRSKTAHLEAEIVQSKAKEAALRESEQKLQASFDKAAVIARMLAENKARLHTLLQSIPDLVWLKDAEGVYLFCNATFERFFGAREADIIGKTDYDFVARELADFFRDHDRRAMAAGKPNSNEEWITFADDGHQALLETIKTPMFDADGSLIGVLGIGRDITERNKAEERQLNLERQLLHAQKLESLGVLSGGIAHDFNNLLMAVLGNLELALGRLPEETAAHKNIERAMSASRHAAKLTNMMLAYSGRGNFIVRELNLTDLVEESADMLAAAIARSVTLDLRLDHAAPQVIADAEQLQQVIMNLITNASEAIVDGSGTITLSTGVRMFDQETLNRSRLEEKLAEGRYVWLEVRDSGCGMDEETQHKLFDPFFTTKFTGRGLGMSAVSGIIRAHRGAFLVESSPGSGTTMLVLLPIASTSQSRQSGCNSGITCDRIRGAGYADNN